MTQSDSHARKPALSLDWWAVLISLLAALLVKLGILKGIAW